MKEFDIVKEFDWISSERFCYEQPADPLAEALTFSLAMKIFPRHPGNDFPT